MIDYREVIVNHWKKISRFFNLEYIPENETDLFEFRAKSGKIISWQLPLTGHWNEIKSKLLKKDLNNYTFLKSNKEIMFILILTYP